MSKPTKKDRRIAALESEVTRLQMLIDPDITFREVEAKISDGTIDIRGVLGVDDGPSPAMKWLGAVMLHAALGEGEHDEPLNYTTAEFRFKPGGQFEEIRAWIEVVKPGGKSSHEIRRDLEAQLAAVTP